MQSNHKARKFAFLLMFLAFGFCVSCEKQEESGITDELNQPSVSDQRVLEILADLEQAKHSKLDELPVSFWVDLIENEALEDRQRFAYFAFFCEHYLNNRSLSALMRDVKFSRWFEQYASEIQAASQLPAGILVNKETRVFLIQLELGNTRCTCVFNLNEDISMKQILKGKLRDETAIVNLTLDGVNYRDFLEK